MLEKDSIQYLRSPLLSGFGDTTHAFLTRKKGVSPPPFDSLNLGASDEDEEENVKENFRLFEGAFGVSPANLLRLRQVHGNRVVAAEDCPGGIPGALPEADAAITGLKNVAVGVLTADCLPVLFHDPVKKAVAAAHAGWRGTAQRVSVKTIEAMAERFGSRPADIRAALGPCIGPCCYAVGENVAGEFPGTKALAKDGGRITLDLGLANVEQLISTGLREENITCSGACTSCSNDTFFSYRKDGGRTGRQLSFIMLKD